MSSSSGAKVTKDPEAQNNPIQEGPGGITSDSLAADSTKSGGAFSENKGAAPLGVDSNSSTLSNTDTSGATKLDSTPNAEARQAQTEWQESSTQNSGAAGQKYPEGAGGQGDFDGQHSAEYGYAGGPTSAKQERDSKQSSGGDYGTSSSGGDSYQQSKQGGTAPSSLDPSVDEFTSAKKPKGKNITEGGFDEDAPNASMGNSDIGTENDPGRVATNDMQRKQAESGPDAAGGPRQKELTKDGQYDVLSSDQAA
ncbi:MAG: hypothetical protein M1827_004072 [Pycnora praestabilis]|nr:MAG: hypothetical protein M1827_004072 [Pycnora praestabilis]